MDGVSGLYQGLEAQLLQGFPSQGLTKLLNQRLVHAFLLSTKKNDNMIVLPIASCHYSIFVLHSAREQFEDRSTLNNAKLYMNDMIDRGIIGGLKYATENDTGH